ncbi:hypothetical protein HGRIS_000127 [Hohenbuehelia grisea]|uniref:Glycerate dehydrogenase n=1 Tax=Hohenbuehelia grisea TaxID=104357 RepID=A0ABR3JQA2_9AGAR
MPSSAIPDHDIRSIQRLTTLHGHISAQTSAEQSNMSNQTLKIVVCRDLGPDVMPLFYERPELDIVTWPHDRPCERAWMLENVPGATGIVVVFGEPVNQEVIDLAGPSLKVVSTMSVGYDHIDLAALKARGIRAGYTPDVLTDAVADLAIMLALMAGRNGSETIDLVQTGQWPQYSWSPYGFCGPQLSAPSAFLSSLTPNVQSQRTAGFIGFGRIGQATLARLVPFGITDVVYYTNPANDSDPKAIERFAKLEEELCKRHPSLKSIFRVSKAELAKQSDVVFVLAPGGPATRHVVDEEFLKEMRRTAVLVNASRGTLVDSDALAKALKEKWLWAAGVDVVEGEPKVGSDHVLVKEPRCTVLPHIGSATLETRLGMATLAAKNLIAGVFNEQMPMELK